MLGAEPSVLPEEKIWISKGLEAEYNRKYPGAFAAADIHPLVVLPGNQVLTLGQLAAVSISTHRDTFPVTAMGSISARGFTQGHRTVAGTLIFHTIDRGAFEYSAHAWQTHWSSAGTGEKGYGAPNADEMPLFDVHFTYANEAGMVSYESLYGVRLLDFGKTVSLENLHPVESYSYMALDYVPLRPLVDPQKIRQMQLQQIHDKRKVTIGGSTPVPVEPNPEVR